MLNTEVERKRQIYKRHIYIHIYIYTVCGGRDELSSTAQKTLPHDTAWCIVFWAVLLNSFRHPQRLSHKNNENLQYNRTASTSLWEKTRKALTFLFEFLS